MQTKIELLCSAPPDQRLMLLLTGPPGIGKTQTVRNSLQQHGERANMGNPRTPPGLHGLFRKYRKARNLVIDDSDHLARSVPCANLTKQVLSPPYIVTYNSRLEESGDEQFRTKFSLIWISNIDYRDESNITEGMESHFNALVSRGLNPIWIGGSDNEVFQYTIWLATEGGMLLREALGKTESEKAVAWFINNRNRLIDVTPRGMFKLVQALKLTKGKLEHREMLLNELLLPKPRQNSIRKLVIPKIIEPGKWDIGGEREA